MDPYSSYNYNPLLQPAVIIAVIIILPIIWLAVTYNKFIRLNNLIKESWSNVDTELRRRYDLIPNLVETVKGYAAHERAVFEIVTNARTKALSISGRPEDHIGAENELSGALKSLFAVSEAYPELKADTQFLMLQKELICTEDRIQAARRFYNGNVRDYNNLVEYFPSSMIAGVCSFSRKNYFEVEQAISEAIKLVFNQMGKS